MTKVKVAKKPEVVKEDVLHFPMPLYDEFNQSIKDFVHLVEKMETIVHEDWKTANSNPFGVDVEVKVALQQKLDYLVYELYGLDEFQVSVIEEGIDRFGRKTGESYLAEEKDYQAYSDYLCNYFNYFMAKDDDISWKSQKQVGDYYTAIRFFFGTEHYLDKGIADLIGVAGLEQINAQLLIQRRILMFEKDGFHIIQSREKNNWSIGMAKKMAAKITRQIMNTGGESNGN
jgi:hypothetical protein